jgi:hypothetical protein
MQISGPTTDVFEMIFEQASTPNAALRFFANIKNTGSSNTMSVRVTATDAFGTTDTDTLSVLAGLAQVIDAVLTTVGVTAGPPYTYYKIEVKSAVGGLSTTFDLRAELF